MNVRKGSVSASRPGTGPGFGVAGGRSGRDEPERSCAWEGCGTVLSRYNDGDLCWRHQAMTPAAFGRTLGDT